MGILQTYIIRTQRIPRLSTTNCRNVVPTQRGRKRHGERLNYRAVIKWKKTLPK